MTPTAFKAARETLGYTQSQMANALRTNDRAVRRWESGEHRVPGSVEVALEFLLKEHKRTASRRSR